MASRDRGQSYVSPHEFISSTKSPGLSKSKYRYIEFKHLYFQIQQVIEKDVVLSFKYEQLKTPELRSSLIKPMVTKIVEFSSTQLLRNTVSNSLMPVLTSTVYETPQFGPVGCGSVGFGTFQASEVSSEVSTGISSCVIYVLLLLRYEYMIQSESHLIIFDLLMTKATICEFLAIRMLREYTSIERINLLFINPMARHDEHAQLKHTKHLDSFNTLELSILSKSKKFLVQPVVIGILNRIYSGELIMNNEVAGLFPRPSSTLSTAKDPVENTFLRPGSSELESGNNGLDCANSEKKIVDYKFNQITINKVYARSNVVPKYQSLVINLKYMFLTFLFLILVLKHRYSNHVGAPGMNTACSVSFWMVALSFNIDVIVKWLHIEYRFLKKIIWTYIDILIVVLIDVSFVMRILLSFDRIHNQTYYNCFSLISILLFPRMLSVFNNYEFFNMIVVSLKKMLWSVIAMFCLFTSLIFGFFLCFVSLAKDMTTKEVAFAMVKIFFGFTPAVWDNWESFGYLGKSLQLSYLSLIQFVLATILAIVLSNIFAKVSETNKEEFEYLKTTNLIIYLKWARFQSYGVKDSTLTVAFDYVARVSKLPIILIIYFYEIIIKENKKFLQKQRKDLKHFTFLNREDDLFGDPDMMKLLHFPGEDDVSSLKLISTRGSYLDTREFGADVVSGSHNLPRKPPARCELIPKHSQTTIAGFRSGSLDSMFIDDFLGKKYGASRHRNISGPRPQRRKSVSERETKSYKLNEQLMQKMTELETMMSHLISLREDSDQFELDEYRVREYQKHEENSKCLGGNFNDVDSVRNEDNKGESERMGEDDVLQKTI